MDKEAVFKIGLRESSAHQQTLLNLTRYVVRPLYKFKNPFITKVSLTVKKINVETIQLPFYYYLAKKECSNFRYQVFLRYLRLYIFRTY